MPCTSCLSDNCDLRNGGHILYEDGTMKIVCHQESKHFGSFIVFVGTEYLHKCFDNSVKFATEREEDSRSLFICDDCIDKAIVAGSLKCISSKGTDEQCSPTPEHG